MSLSAPLRDFPSLIVTMAVLVLEGWGFTVSPLYNLESKSQEVDFSRSNSGQGFMVLQVAFGLQNKQHKQTAASCTLSKRHNYTEAIAFLR